jgi:putative ABC transport system permease protein
MKWHRWLKRRSWEQRMDAEFQFHLDSRRTDYISQGLSPQEADQRARRDFGPVELAKDECRAERRAGWFDHLLRDLRYAFRSLRKSPGFATAAIITLTLGTGANTTIFQLLDAVRLRTLPVQDPRSLVTVQLADRTGWRGSQATQYPALTNPLWERLRDTQEVFSGVLAWGDSEFNLNPGGEARLARGLFVSGDFFRVLGVQPLIGRIFTAADDHRGCGLSGAVISFAFWQRELGGDASIVGRKLTLNFQPVEVIGVTPAGFSGLEIGRSYDVAVPICSQAVLWNEGNWLDAGTVWWLNVMGRLRPGGTLERTNAQLRVASPAIFQTTLPTNYPAANVKDYLNFKLAAVPGRAGVSGLRANYGQPLLLLLATSGLVLLVACANLANLALARATARGYEFAVRLAMGASRRRLVRQLMVENSLLALGGVIGGTFLSRLLSKFLISLLGTKGNPLFLNLEPDVRILAFTAGLAGLTCMLFGLTPALRASSIAPGDAMKAGGRALSAGRERIDLRQVLVVSQVALSLALLVGALLFSGSLRNLLAVDAGFQRNGVVITNLDFSRLKIPSDRRVAFKRDLLHRIRSLPGIAEAAQIGILPLSGGGTDNRVWKEGTDPGNNTMEANFDWLSDGCLKTLGIPLLLGRDFSERDTLSSPKVAIVNQSFTRRLGLPPNPVGAKFRREATPSQPEQVFEIVGLVRDTKYYSLRESFLPIAFLSIDQDAAPNSFPQFLIRSSVPLIETTSALRTAITQISPVIGIDFQSFEERLGEGLLRDRLMATLSSFFGLLATLISALGIYGVMSYLVVRRTNEIGVRMAVGAGRGSIVALILGQGSKLLAVGIGAGAVLTLAVAGTAQSIVFGMKSYDARTLAVAAALLTVVALVASYLPARRAARLEPISALREE